MLSSPSSWPTGTGFIAGTGTVVIQAGIILPTDISTYYNLTIASAATTVTLGVGTTVNSNLTITSGTLSVSASNFALNVKGNWSQTGGTFNAGSGTVVFNGTASQSISGTSLLNNVTLNNAAGLVLNTDLDISGILSLTSGVVSTGAYSIFIQSTGSVTRTSGHVFGSLTKTVGVGATSRTFEIDH